mgnify:CR=1 FL=1
MDNLWNKSARWAKCTSIIDKGIYYLSVSKAPGKRKQIAQKNCLHVHDSCTEAQKNCLHVHDSCTEAQKNCLHVHDSCTEAQKKTIDKVEHSSYVDAEATHV